MTSKKPDDKPFDFERGEVALSSAEKWKTGDLKLLEQLLDGDQPFKPEDLAVASGVLDLLQANLVKAASETLREEYAKEFGEPPEATVLRKLLRALWDDRKEPEQHAA
jgi:hypothetical protein